MGKNPLIQPEFIPASKEDLEKIGWDEIDVLLVSGDAYVDHPSFGISIIGRVLIAAGYRVGIIAQPDWRHQKSIRLLGVPRLACAISSGNMDSMLNLYTAGCRLRKHDAFSPGGKTNLRPPRALTVYANLARSAFANIFIIIGGIEASMRRFSHYDYWKDKILPGILVNTKADLLAYGMGEKVIVEVIDKLSAGKDLKKIKGTSVILGKKESEKFIGQKNDDYRMLPSHEKILSIPGSLLLSHKITEEEMNPYSGTGLAQPYRDRVIISEPAVIPLSTAEMDSVYDLPFAGRPHPMYKEKIPAFEMIKDSIISVRGCPGGCSFCGLGLHQGKFLSSRSENSILKEVRKLLKKKDFHGTISDVGGPTANAYGNKSAKLEICKKCRRSSCLYPKICKNYLVDENRIIHLLQAISKLPKIKHLFINSGLRLDLALHQKNLMKLIIKNHVSGHLKVAPEHLDKDVLNLMRKNPAGNFLEFIKFFEEETRTSGKKQYILPYFISNFPGCDNKAMEKVDQFLSKTRWSLQQVQDFIPLPMTIASAMYHECLDDKANPIKVNKGLKARRHQVNILKKKRHGKPCFIF